MESLTLTVRVTPKARRSAFAGMASLPDGRQVLAVRVAAPPVDGAANAALVAFLAKELGVGKGAVSLVSGATSRLKVVRIEAGGEEAARKLRDIVAAAAGSTVPTPASYQSGKTSGGSTCPPQRRTPPFISSRSR